MKYNIKNIIGIVAFVSLIFSCDTNDEITGYVPASYTQPQSFTLTVDAATATDNSFEVTYTPTASGKGYYVVSTASSGAPTSTQVHSGSAAGLLQSGSFDVDGSTPVKFTVDTDLFGGYEYKIYAIHKSDDDFISEATKVESFTTPDTMDPVFSPGNSVPTNATGFYDPTSTNVFLNFSEPVFYNAGDVTLTGTRSGENIVISGGFSQVQNVFIGFNPGLLVEDEVYVVSFDADTFRDVSGKPVAEAAFGAYFWATDDYTTEYELSQLFGGLTSKDFDYTLTDNVGFAGFGLPIPLTGTYTVNLDGDKSEFFNALDQTYGDDSFAFKVRYEAVSGNDLDGPDSFGFIYLEPNPQQSLFTSGGLDLFWNAWYDFAEPNLTGFYDTSDGSIDVDVDFGDYNGFDGSNYFGDLFYDYTPTVTKSTPIKRATKIEVSAETMFAVKASTTSSIENVDLYNFKKSPSVKELSKPYRAKTVLNSLEKK